MNYKFCVKCGKKIAPDATFCRFCGAQQPANNSASNEPQSNINNNQPDSEYNSYDQPSSNKYHSKQLDKVQREKDRYNSKTERQKNKIAYRKQQYRLEQQAHQDKEYQDIEKHRTINIVLLIVGWIIPWIPMFFSETIPDAAWESIGLIVSLGVIGMSCHILHEHQGFRKNSFVLMAYGIIMVLLYFASFFG